LRSFVRRPVRTSLIARAARPTARRLAHRKAHTRRFVRAPHAQGTRWRRGAATRGRLPGNDITYINHEDLTHGFIQLTEHSRRCLEATEELARHLGVALRK